MSVNLEQTAMLSWNQPIVEVPAPQETVKEVFELPDYMKESAPPVVVIQPVTIEPVISQPIATNLPNPANIVINDPVVHQPVNDPITEPVVAVIEVEPVVVDIVIPADVIIPLEGMKPTDDITQEDLNDSTCSPEETQKRLAFCKTCPKFKIENMITKCSACDCSISMVSTFKYKACPVGNW